MQLALALLAIAIPLWLNIKASRLVAHDGLSERGQKIAQLLIVWLVPVFGAVVVLAVHRTAEPSSRHYRESPDPGDDFALSGRTIKNTREVLDGDD